MKLTCASAYALQALAFMAGQKNDKPIASHHVAKARAIPERFLLKVLKPLVGANVLVSTKGPHGGYKLARAAGDITLLEVIEAVDGPIRGHVPVGDEPNPAVNSGLIRRLESACNCAAGVLKEHLRKVKLSEVIGSRR